MERLTERELCGGTAVFPQCQGCFGDCVSCEYQDNANEKLKHYEDLEEQGLLLKLKPIKGFEQYYAVDVFGCVYGIAKENVNGRRIMKRKTCLSKNGYVYVTLKANGKNRNVTVHRIVAEAFIPNPNDLPEVNHIDGNKSNNSVWNLEWCSKSQNLKHATDNHLNIPPTNCIDGVWMNGNNKYVVITNTITKESILYTSIKKACADIGRGKNYIYDHIKKGEHKFNSRECVIQVFLTKAEAEKALAEMGCE